MTVTNRARFKINGTPSEHPTTGDRGYDVLAGAALAITLELNPARVLSVVYSLPNPSDTEAPVSSINVTQQLFTENGLSSITLASPNDTVHVTVNAITELSSYVLRCTVVDDVGTHVFERIVSVREAGLRMTVPAERQQYNAGGWSTAMNEMALAIAGLLAGSGGLAVTGSPVAGNVPTWNGTVAVWQAPAGGLPSIPTDTLVGRDAAGTGAATSIAIDSTLAFTGANVIQRAALTGAVTAPAGSNVTTLAAGVVGYTNLANIASATLIGRDSVGVGAPEAILLNATLEFDGAHNLRRAALTGDVTAAAGSNVLTVSAGAITLSKFANINTDKLLGRDTAGLGAPEEIGLDSTLSFTGSGSIQRAALTGDVTASAGSNSTTIAAGAVTFAKMANISTDTLIGRDTAGNGVPEAIGLDSTLVFTGSLSIGRAALTGAVTAPAGSNVTTLAAGVVSPSNLAAIAALSVLGNGTNASATPTAIAGTDGLVLRVSGTALAFGTIVTAGIADGAVTIAKLANGTASSVLGRSAATGGAYADIVAASDGQVLRRGSAGVVGFGQVDVASANAITGLLPFANIANGSALSVFGRSANTAGVQASIVGTDGQVLRVAGTTLGFGAIVTAGITDGNVTLAKLANATASSVLGRSAATGGAYADIPSSADGQVLRRGASGVIAFGALDLSDPDATTGSLPFSGLTPGSTAGQALIWSGSAWAPSTDFIAQNLTTTGALRVGTGPYSTFGDIRGGAAFSIAGDLADNSDYATIVDWGITTSNVLYLGDDGFDMRFRGYVSIPQVASSGAAAKAAFKITAGAHVALPLGTELIDVDINLDRFVQFAAGALATQRAMVIRPPSYRFVSSSTLAVAATLSIVGAPVASTNATITDRFAFMVEADDVWFKGGVAVGTARSGLSVLGRSASTAGSMAAITGTDGQILRVSGTTLAFGTITTAGIADGSITLAKLANATASSVLGRSAASTGVYADIASSVDGQVLRRGASGVIAFGQIDLANTTAAVTGLLPFANIANGSALSVFGRSANTAGVMASIVGTDGQVLRVSGTTLGFGTIVTAGIADANVTLAKLADSTASSVLGRSAATTGPYADIASSADGQVLRRGASGVIAFGAVDLASAVAITGLMPHANIASLAGLSVFGRSANTTGVMAAMTGTDGQILRVSGTTLGFGTITTAGIADGSITLAKLANASASSVLGRSAATTGVYADIVAASDGQVLRRASAGVVGFGAVDLTSANAVTGALPLANLPALAGLSVLGNSTNVSATMAAITGTDGQVLRVSGTTLGFGTIVTAGIADANVTLAKLANGTAASLLGRSAGTSGVYADIASSANGQVMRRSAGALGFGNPDFQQLPLAAGITTVQPPVATSGNNSAFVLNAAAHTGQTASAELIDVDFALNRTVQFATGAITSQRAIYVRTPTYGFVGASVITDAASLAIQGSPNAGTNATITNSYSLWVQSGQVRIGGLITGFVKSSSTGILSSNVIGLSDLPPSGTNGRIMTTVSGVAAWSASVGNATDAFNYNALTHTFQIAGTTRFDVSGTAITLNVDTFYFLNGVTNPNIGQQSISTAGGTAQTLLITGQFQTGTGATVGGTVHVLGGNSTNGTGGSVSVRSGTGLTAIKAGNWQAYLGNTVIMTWAGSEPVSTIGTLRLPSGGSLAFRNFANSANVVGMTINSSNDLVIGDSNAASLYMNAPGMSFVTTSGVMTFDSTGALNLQNASAAPGSNPSSGVTIYCISGELWVRGGSGTIKKLAEA